MGGSVTPARRAVRRTYRSQCRMAWTGLVTILAMLLSLFPQVAGLPVPTASAHNLQTRNVYAYFDLDTQAMLDARIASPDWTPPTPLLQVGDEIGLVLKGVPRDGTTTGVGGYIDFYIPNGVTVIDAAYLRPGDAVADGITGFDRVPMKGQSPIAMGAGPIGAKAQTALINLTLGPNINGVSEKAVADGTGLMRGTIAGVYGDTGIFFATHPDTAWNTWASTGGFDQNPVTNDNTITNNSGDVIVPLNKWDAEQLLAFGAKSPIVAIVDTPDQRGNAPWGMASGVAGPQSGYAWDFDWDYWRTNPHDPIRMKNASDQMGPWQRIRYAGSGISKDQAGSTSTVLGFASIDGSTVGYPLSPGNPLPPTVSQTDTSSPKVIRWSVGQTTQYVPEYVWVKLRVNQLTGGLIQPDGCPYFYTGAFGGDAGGDDDGKDHLWRYYEPTTITLNGCVAVGKPADRPAVKPGDIFSYKIKFYNAGLVTLTNVVVKDTLPSGVAFISAVPAQNSGPNPLVWNVGTLLPGQKWEATVTVKATGTGPLENTVTVTSNQFPPQTTTEITPSGSIPILSQSKSVTPTTVAPGGTVQYTIRIDNIGSGPSGSPLSITEYLPAGFTFVSKDLVTLNGANVTGTTTVNASNPNQPVFNVPGAVNAGQSLILKFTAQVGNTVTAGSYCNYYSTAAGSSPRQTTGFQACVNVAAGTIGDTVFRDWDGDGVQDPEDEGLPGVTVTLKAGACPGGATVATTTTSASGNYLFAGLSTPATYCVDVTPPAGYTLTTPPVPRTVALALNETNLTADFGYKPGGAGAIGDKVFEDVDNNGVFGTGDFGIANVTVWLYEDTNNDGVITPGADALVATAQSDSNGDYLFSGLATGINYLVKVDKNDPDIQAYFNTKYGAATPYQLSTVEIKPSPNLTGSDLDNDFGFWRVLPASIGDQVFIDNNGNGVYDSGDTPLAGITVTLLRDGQPFKTTVSGPDGTYLFDNLGPGNYTVIVDTADPDLPAGLFETVTQYEKTLAAGENYLTADFPFVSGLSKMVDKAYATAGQTLNFTLKPYYPGTALLENVRIIDPLPTGTTYVAGSANAGGTFGPYTPLPAVPGSDPAGGPSETVQLDTTITPSAIFATVGGTAFNVTLNVKQNSGSTVNNVSPVDFEVSGGTATCTGPTPASANVPSGATGSNFVWSCVATSAGELIFSAAAENNTQTYQWPIASSASVLAAPYGGPNVVTWNLGTNVPGVPGETLTSGYTAGIYAFRGASTKEFSKYSITSNAWATRAQPTNGIEKGGSLTTDGAGTLYALEGNSKIFYKYTIATNTWSSLPQTSDNVSEGGAVQYLKVGGTEYVFALLGGSNRFRRYTVGGSWATATSTPANVKKGGALTTDGTYIYALRGDRQKSFWRCNATTSGGTGSCFGTGGTWIALADTPAGVGWGGSLTRIGNYIYAFQGNGKTAFWRYDITANSWTALASAPGNVSEGGALTTDGTYVYALQGKTKSFWRYNPATNVWTTLASTNFTGTVGQGGALVYEPGSTPIGRFTTMSATPSLVSTGNRITARLRLESSTAVNNVVPTTLTVTPTGGASCSAITGPTLLSADNNIADINDPVLYQWVCTVAAGANPGALTFSAGGTGDGPTSFPTAQSRSVLVSPVLTFQVTVNAGAPAVIENTGILAETSGAFDALVSNTTQTATSGSIGDRVWNDVHADGVQDTGEFGLAGVKVCIDSDNSGACDPGEPYDITDANGLYRIYGLGAGTYTVRTDPATYPAGYLPTTASSLSVTLTAGQQYNDADFGLAAGTGVIGDTVWLDANNNGALDGTEQGLPNIVVKLYRDLTGNGLTGDDVLLGTNITDAAGSYLFEGLPAGNYVVVVDETSTVTSPYNGTATLAAAMDPVFGTNLANVTLSSGQAYLDADFPYNWNGSIGDYVWYDTDFDGVQDAGEPPIQGAFVMLYFDANGNGVIDQINGDYQVAGRPTNASGLYLFQNLPPGNYLVDVYEDSITTDGMRDVVPTTPNVVPVTLGPGASVLTADFGYYEGARVEGNVFWDEDRNGLLDPDEQTAPYLLPNVAVTIVCAGTDGILGTGDDFTASKDTDANGHFVFIVPAGLCTLSYNTADPDIPAGLGDATTPTSFTFTAIAGEDWHPSFDFGVDNTGKIGDTVWHDANNNGSQDVGEPGLANVTVLLYLDNNNNNLLDAGDTFLAADVTGANGKYLFEGLADGNYIVVVNAATLPAGFTQTYDNSGPLDGVGQADIIGGAAVNTVDFGYRYSPPGGASLFTIGGRVYNDLDNSGNDESEPGFANVDVTVVCDYGTFVVQTNPSGDWSLAGVPQGSVCTVLDADENDLPRRDYAATETPTTPITVNGDIGGLDFGYNQRPGSISGTVCQGSGDGVCNPGEAGISGVTVVLTWFGLDNILGTADDTVITTTTTITGFYSFTNLQPGLYQIVEINLPGYTSLTDADGGHPDNISPVVLPLGGAITGRDFEDAPPPSVEVTKVLTAPISGVAVVSDIITFTIRITNTGITALPTLTITDTYDANYLTLTSHSIVPDAQTPGVITWINSLAPFLPLLPGQALTITVGFRADVSTYPGVTENRVRVTGEDVLGVLVEPRTAADNVQIIRPSIGVAKQVVSNVNNGDGTYDVTYQLVVENFGDVPLSNVQVTDNLAATFPASASFSVVSVTSTGFTVNPGYNGSSDINLLTATGNTLAVGQTKTIVLTVRVTPAASPATYNNQAAASGVSPAGAQVSDVSQVGVNPDPDGDGNPGNNGEPTPVTLAQTPGIAVVKTGPAASYVGGSVVYTYTVTNTGNVRLDSVTVTDNKCSPVTYVSGDANGNGYLDVNETWIFTCTYTVQAGDPDPLVNIATAQGVSPLGVQVRATDDWTADLVSFSIGDRVWLDADGDGFQDLGETTGFYNVPIVITGTDVDGGTVNFTVYTDLNGNYLALLAKPGTYTVTAPAGFSGYAPSTPTVVNVTLTPAAPNYLNADFGYVMPTGLYIMGPEATVVQGQVRVTWQATLPEGMQAPAFHVWRSAPDGAWQRLTAERVSAGSFDGMIYSYAYTDVTAQRGAAYLYQIEADSVTYGPCQVTVPGVQRVFLPLVWR